MSECDICHKTVAVSLYLRVKPIVRGVRIPKDTHRFFGYWPPESHLVEYIKAELRVGSYLGRLYENNCRGHSIEDIVEAIEQLAPPEVGVPIKILWNPGTKVTPYLLAETPAQREQAKMELQQDLRTIVVSDRSQVKMSILYLLNNTVEFIPSSLSFSSTPVHTFETPWATQSWTPAGAYERIMQIEAANRCIWEQFVAAASRYPVKLEA